MPAPATIHTINNREMNKILTLTVKPEQLAEVASGEKTTITREIRPQTSSKYIEYFDEYGRVYKTYEEVPDEIEIDVRPLRNVTVCIPLPPAYDTPSVPYWDSLPKVPKELVWTVIHHYP